MSGASRDPRSEAERRKSARLAPFGCELVPPGGAPLALRGRIDDGRYRLIAERRGQAYELELSASIERGTEGSFAWVEAGVQPLGPGLWVTLEHVDQNSAAAARGAALSLRIETRSAALDRGGPVFARLGGGPALARLLSPPRWSASLSFDALGQALRAGAGADDVQ